MGDLKFVRLSRESVRNIGRFIDGVYNEKTLNLCKHPHVITEVRGEDLSVETQLFNELVLWLRYCRAIVSRRPVHLDLLARMRADYDVLMAVVQIRPDLEEYRFLAEIDVVHGAVYDKDYLPRIDRFLRGLYGLSDKISLSGGPSGRAAALGFVNLHQDEIRRLMRSVKEASKNCLTCVVLDVRDVFNTDPVVLAFNRLVYLCRLAYALARAWKETCDMCVNRINTLRRQLSASLQENASFSRVYARNALDLAVDLQSVHKLAQRIDGDFLLFKNALRWGDPNWSRDLYDEEDDEDVEKYRERGERFVGEEERGSILWPRDDNPRSETEGFLINFDDDSGSIVFDDDEFDRRLQEKMGAEWKPPFGWWRNPTGVPGSDESDGDDDDPKATGSSLRSPVESPVGGFLPTGPSWGDPYKVPFPPLNKESRYDDTGVGSPRVLPGSGKVNRPPSPSSPIERRFQLFDRWRREQEEDREMQEAEEREEAARRRAAQEERRKAIEEEERLELEEIERIREAERREERRMMALGKLDREKERRLAEEAAAATGSGVRPRRKSEGAVPEDGTGEVTPLPDLMWMDDDAKPVAYSFNASDGGPFVLQGERVVLPPANVLPSSVFADTTGSIQTSGRTAETVTPGKSEKKAPVKPKRASKAKKATGRPATEQDQGNYWDDGGVRVGERFSNVEDIRKGIEGMGIGETENVLFQPMPSRGFEDSPFGPGTEEQPSGSGSSSFTVLGREGHGENDEAM